MNSSTPRIKGFKVLETYPLTWRPDNVLNPRKRKNGKRTAEDGRRIAKWKIFERFNYTCWLCKNQALFIGKLEKTNNPEEITYAPIVGNDFLTEDHLWPQSLGGGRDNDNIAPACRACNNNRGSDLDALNPIKKSIQMNKNKLFCKIVMSEDDGRAGAETTFVHGYKADTSLMEEFIHGNEWYQNALRKYLTGADLLRLRNGKTINSSSKQGELPSYSIKITPIWQKEHDEFKAGERSKLKDVPLVPNLFKRKAWETDDLMRSALSKLTKDEIVLLGLGPLKEMLDR